jgi:DNA-directed RNA polymerase subunit RPC12/RpoP
MFPEWRSENVTLRDVFRTARDVFSIPDDLDLYLQPPRQMVFLKTCLDCGKDIDVFKPVIQLVREQRKGIHVTCPHCGSTRTRNHPMYGVVALMEEVGFPFLDLTLEQLGSRRLDILTLLTDDGETQNYYYMEITGDIEGVLPGWKD